MAARRASANVNGLDPGRAGCRRALAGVASARSPERREFTACHVAADRSLARGPVKWPSTDMADARAAARPPLAPEFATADAPHPRTSDVVRRVALVRALAATSSHVEAAAEPAAVTIEHVVRTLAVDTATRRREPAPTLTPVAAPPGLAVGHVDARPRPREPSGLPAARHRGAGRAVSRRQLLDRRWLRRRASTGRQCREPSALGAGKSRVPPLGVLDCRRQNQMPDSRPRTRYIFVTGGVVSSLGKGIAAASIGRLLVARGLKVALQKFDPYINVDPGTMSPFQHGEVFVTEDGAETDLDLGHYERFTDANTSRASNVTAGGDLQLGDPQGAPRRLPRRHRPGRPAHHRRDQAPHPARRREPGRRRRDHRDRRHGRRHRVAAVPRGDPAVPGRRRPAPVHVHPPHARAVHRPRGRAEDEADAALGQRAAPHRHPARHGRLPLRGRAVARHPQEDRAVRVAAGRGGRLRRATSTTSTRCRSTSRPRASTTSCSSTSARGRAARPERVEGLHREGRRGAAVAPGPDRARRQVRPARGRLPVGRRGAAPLRLRARLRRRDRLGRLRDARRRARSATGSRRPTAS